MRFIIAFQTRKRTFVMCRGKKKYYSFISMVIAILYKLLSLEIEKEELLRCLNIAEDMYNKDNNKKCI